MDSSLVGHIWAAFIRYWYQQYETFEDSDWGSHSVRVPAIMVDMYPWLIHTEARTFYNNQPNFGALAKLLVFGSGNLYDWRTNNYAVYLYGYRLARTQNHTEQTIKTWNTTAGEVLIYMCTTETGI